MRVSIDSEKLDLLANIISDKSGEPIPMTLAEMTDAVDGIQTGGVTPTGNINITQAGVTDVTNYATVTVPEADAFGEADIGYTTRSGQRKWDFGAWLQVEEGGWVSNNIIVANTSYDAVPTGTSVTPTESAQTIGGRDYMMEGAVTVNAIPSNYVGSGITRRSSSDLTASGATVTAPAGYYESSATKTVASGTAGTPTATKGTVTNHSVSVTPSVTNTTGYITGSTKTGTPVTVSASELVSGSQTITQNGTVDVTNLQSITVAVEGGGGSSKNIQVNSDAASVRTNGYTATSITLTVAKTGTYKVSWTAWRSSSSGTMGTNLHRNNTTGTNQQTWTNTYGQHIVLNNQSYTAGDVLTLYATAGSTSRYCWVSNLIIEEQ